MSNNARRHRRLLAGMLAGALALSVMPILGFSGVASAQGEVADPTGEGNFCEDVPQSEPFTDVQPTDPSYGEIVCLVATEITTGVTATTYEPNSFVTRRQMALFLVRLANEANRLEIGDMINELPAPADTDFTDTEDEEQFIEDAISQITQAGVAEGFPDGSYRPAAPVSRRQMAAFIDRMYEFLTGEALAPATEDHFADDNADSAEAQASTNAVAEAGIFIGNEDGTFRPAQEITRRQMANVLTRTLQVLMEEGFITQWAAEGTTNQDFTVSPGGAQTVNGGDTTQYTVTGIGADFVDIVLVPCEDVTTDENGVVTFADEENAGAGNNRADLNGTSAFITVINGVATSDGDQIAVGDNGTVTFTVEADEAECYVPVVFADADDDDNLDLDADNAPTEEFGLGGETTVNPDELAAFADTSGCVVFVDTAEDFYTLDEDCDGDADVLVNYAQGDVFEYEGALITMAQFEQFLSEDDFVIVENYNPGASTHNIDDDVPNAPTGVAVTAEERDDDDVVNDITVTWNDSTGGRIDGYVVEIYEDDGDATTDCEDGVFVDDQFVDATAPNEAEFDDLGDDEYCAVVFAISDTGDGSDYSDDDAFEIDEEANDVTAPLITDTRIVTDAGTPAVIDTGDVVALQFNEGMSPAIDDNGSVFRFTDPDGEIFQVTCGTNATCVLGAGNINADADQTDPGEPTSRLVVTLTADPVKVGGPVGDGAAQVPGTITELGPTFDDASGNQVDLAASPDKVIDNEL